VKQSTPWGAKQNTPGRHSRDFSTYNMGKIITGGEGKTYSARHCEVHAALKKEIETTYICKFYVLPLQRGSFFEIYHLIRYCKPLYMQFLQYWVQKYHLYSETVRI
jgi:hypothetical protein